MIVEKKSNQDLITYDEHGNALVIFDNNLHIVTNGDFTITVNGEVSVLSKTAISLDCALLLLNCRLGKQIREMKHELRMQFIDMLGGMPDLSEEQKYYLKATKLKAVKLLDLNEDELSHIDEE